MKKSLPIIIFIAGLILHFGLLAILSSALLFDCGAGDGFATIGCTYQRMQTMNYQIFALTIFSLIWSVILLLILKNNKKAPIFILLYILISSIETFLEYKSLIP